MLTPKDEAFLQVTQDLKFLTPEQSQECRASYEAIAATGAKISLSKLLQDKGHVTQEKLTAITAELRTRGVHPNVGPYDVLTRLGAGGSATVYKAVDPRDKPCSNAEGSMLQGKRVVALKVLAPALAADSNSVQRFIRGAELAAKVKHENVAETYEIGRDGTRYYIAMEFVQGTPLSEMATEGKPLSEADALRIIKQIADALATCHAQGIIHRDVKPSNIMVTPSGTAKLLDLGLARPTEAAQTDVTMTGHVVGTPHFMSPEQCAGLKDVDARADVYSLGATLFYAVTGRPPFAGETTYEVMKQQSSAQLPDPRQFNPAVSGATHLLIWKMMAKTRKLRIQTAREVVEAITKRGATALPAIQSGATGGVVPAPGAPEAFALDEGGAAGKDAAGDELLAEMRNLLEALQTPDASGKLSRTVLKRVNLIDQRLAAIRGFLAQWEDYGSYLQRAKQRAPLTADDEEKFAALQAQIAGQYGGVLPLLAQRTRGGRIIQSCREKAPLSGLAGSPAVADALEGSLKAGAKILRDFADFLGMARRRAISQNLVRYTVEKYGRTSWGMTIGAVLIAGFLSLIGWLTLFLPARYATKLEPPREKPPISIARPPKPPPAAEKTTPAIAETGKGPAAGMTEAAEAPVEEETFVAAPGAGAAKARPGSAPLAYGNVPFLRVDARDFDWPSAPDGKPKLGQARMSTNGTYCQVLAGWRITKRFDVRRPGPCYVFVRCCPTNVERPFIVQFGQTVAGPVDANKGKGQVMRWARLGPFDKLVPASACELTLTPTGAYHAMVDQVVVTSSPNWRAPGEEVETFSNLKLWDIPGEEVLADCVKINVDPPAYRTGHFIVQASPERIFRGVAWAKYVETTVYPTMLQMLGYTPDPDLHAVVFQDDTTKSSLSYTGFGNFNKTDIRASMIWVRSTKLDAIPPYPTSGGIAWGAMQALMDESRHKPDWKPMGKTDLLVTVFEMELYKRLHMQPELDSLYNSKVTQQKSGPRYADFGLFWKQQGWQPFQKLIVKLHENPNFRPTLDEGTFVYEMSLGAGKDVSAFFEQRGWKVPPETKTRVRDQLNHQ